MSVRRLAARLVGRRKDAKDLDRDAAQVIELQAQVQDGKSIISALEARITTLTAALERAEADAAEAVVLRDEVQSSYSTIASLNTRTIALQAQARTRENATSSAEAKVTQLSVALEKSQADVTRLSAMWMDALGKDRIIFSLEFKLDMLQDEAKRREETISSLDSRIVSLSLALESAKREIQLQRGPVLPNSCQCEHCTPPIHISTAKARGKWLRRKAEVFNEEAGKVLFEALNPELVGPRARLYNDIRIDLHLQFRSPAVEYVKKYTTSARDQGLDSIIFIVGKGLHSADNLPKLRPLVLDTLKSLGLEAYLPQNNPGEIVLRLQKKADRSVVGPAI